MTRKHFVYFVRCNDSSLYIGNTTNLDERIMRHNNLRGASWVRQHGRGEIVYSERYDTYVEARRREQQLMRWSRAKKEALVAGDRKSLKKL